MLPMIPAMYMDGRAMPLLSPHCVRWPATHDLCQMQTCKRRYVAKVMREQQLQEFEGDWPSTAHR